MLGSNAKVKLLWLHDLVPLIDYPDFINYQLNAVLTQSIFHSNWILRGLNSQDYPTVEVLENAVHISDSNGHRNLAQRNDNNVFVYASAPNRGLEHILRIWPIIKIHFPKAILRIYYGFGRSINERLIGLMGQAEFDSWYLKMMDLISQDGIEYIGSVDHVTLEEGLSTSGFLLYPSTFPETGCITVMRSMLLGAIPVTSRYFESALFNLTMDHDLGPPPELALKASDIKIQSVLDSWINEIWLKSLISIKFLSDAELSAHRTRMIADAAERFTWSKAAATFESLVLSYLQ
jgi:protein O-GlcNAc transferase